MSVNSFANVTMDAGVKADACAQPDVVDRGDSQPQSGIQRGPMAVL